MNKAGVKNKIRKAAELGQEAGAISFRTYANDYIRYDTGNARNSSLVNSEVEKGIVNWITDYIRIIYYMGKAKRDKNPKASLRWGHKAAKLHKKYIEKDIQKVFDKNL